jgi:hypothetical protein
MKNFPSSNKLYITTASLVVIMALTFFMANQQDDVSYSLQVKPILNKRCIACHGGVRKKGGFSLLFREEALDTTESGKFAIVPGHPEKSEMIRRLTLNDPEERMPFKHDPLPNEEIELLTTWIKQGAKWGEHWAYVSVKETPPPSINLDWIRNDIDRFIYDKLKSEALEPSADADASTLVRRVSLDLTGLPPTTRLAERYLKNPSNEQYEKLVDSLLASPAFGERWASMWMDLSRYADSKGYEKDSYRNIWKYRDWLIKAFNTDKPYNQFLTEQLAGDLFPDPSDDLFIATAFHRNTMTNDEGGTDSEEFRTAAVLDRVNTTWEVLMGTTFACVQCHSHPYDPFKHDEYYKFMAFFNNTRDNDTSGDYPLLRQYHKEDSVKLMEVKAWLDKNVTAEKSKEQYTFLKTGQPIYYSLTCKPFGNAVVSEANLLVRKNGGGMLKHVDLTGKTNIIFNCYTPLEGGLLSLRTDSENGDLLATIPLKANKNSWQTIEKEIKSADGYHDLYLTYTNASINNMDENAVYFDWFHFDNSFPGKGKPGYEKTKAASWELLTNSKFTTTPVMMENPSNMFRASHVFERGNWMVKGEQVEPNVPHVFNPMSEGAPKNRLGLAQWLTDKKNPLVSRTLVNRLWEQLFGFGIVETVEDLGSQGLAPTHRELLDHLSWKFMNDYQWSLKRLLKEMVMSSTYRQDSKSNPELNEKDPYNKLYARGPRVRLTAEQLRDQALAVSGLLNRKMYGSSVMPYQPKGIWLSPYNGETWRKSEKGNQYRRALYTHWKRTAPYPSMLTFDGGAREVCVSRRIRTNTPLQALVTLNDSTYFEMAIHLANRMNEEPRDVKVKISNAYQWMMFKPITPERLNVLGALYNNAINKESTFKKASNTNEGQSPESKALTVVANALLNLDEWITKN